MSRGAAATEILKAIMARKTFEDSGVPDTPHNRQVWESMQRDVAKVPPGDVVDIPTDWSDT
jgi:hypothetical protein